MDTFINLSRSQACYFIIIGIALVNSILLITYFQKQRQSTFIDSEKMTYRDWPSYDSEKMTSKYIYDSEKMTSGLESYHPVHQLPPDQAPATVHIVWCGKKYFTFADYLSVLSAIRILEPLKLIFHFNHMPMIDSLSYYTWFQELKKSLPNLIMKKTNRKLECNTTDSVRYGLEQIVSRPGGGVYIGERTLLTHIPTAWSSVEKMSYFKEQKVNHQHGIIYTRRGSNNQSLNIEELTNSRGECVTETEFEIKAKGELSPCLILTKDIYPRDIINTTSRLAEFARWVNYGKSARIVPPLGPDVDDQLIPNICHMIYIKDGDTRQNFTWPFHAYLGALSAIHVAGCRHIYVYSNVEIGGEWWGRLKHENITVVEIDYLETVFQTPIPTQYPTYAADVLRILILLKYGGVFMDWDVIWANHIPRSLRRYANVMGPDFALYGAWPQIMNPGIMMAKPKAMFLQLLKQSFSEWRHDPFGFNACYMPYKIWERHPDLLYEEKHLQVTCLNQICHAAWQKDYIRDINNATPTLPFKLEDTVAFHFPTPDIDPRMSTISKIKEGKNIFAELGRKVLKKSGHIRYYDNQTV